MLIRLTVIGTSQQTQNVFITFVQRRPNVFDVGPTLYKCYKKMFCIYWGIVLYLLLTVIGTYRLDTLQ